jgi:hypothetical protein
MGHMSLVANSDFKQTKARQERELMKNGKKSEAKRVGKKRRQNAKAQKQRKTGIAN